MLLRGFSKQLEINSWLDSYGANKIGGCQVVICVGACARGGDTGVHTLFSPLHRVFIMAELTCPCGTVLSHFHQLLCMVFHLREVHAREGVLLVLVHVGYRTV